ncbi:MAG: Fe-S cluster assembly protein SufD [Thermoleophilia bacterium]|nr:Fe-S cluster assembly protein SufD [Thermoleophilia bacterium]
MSERAGLFEAYRSLPLPTTRDEHWRFTDVSGFDPEAWAAAPVAAPAGGRAFIELDAAGIATLDERGIEIHSAPAGVRFEPLDDAHDLLGSLVRPNDKFRAHNAAAWKHGLLVHVPAGVELERPLFLRVANTTAGGSLLWRVLVIADPGARFTLIEEVASGDPALSGYANAAVEIIVREGAKVEYVNVQNLSNATWLFSSGHARVERDAELDWVTGGFGSAKGKAWIQNDLAGRGATSRVTGAYFADGAQHLDYDTYQLHAAPDTTSDFAFKGALRDTARTVWRGMIRVEPGAQKTNAYQENRNLLLSKTAVANSIPGLEILANDVRCTHGATLSQVDREQLFYAMARGLPRAEAERLIVRGFFQDVLDRVALEPVRHALGEALEARIPRA